MGYVVAVVEHDTDRVVKTFKPCSTERQAEKLKRAVEINLDHRVYYVDILPPNDPRNED